MSRRLGRIEVEGVAAWKGAARAAYSIVHDDLGDESADGIFEHAGPELARRGLRGAMAAIAEPCERRHLWDRVERLALDGHEIANHTWSHQNLCETSDWEPQIERATRALEKRLGRGAASFFVFPYDAFNPEVIAYLDVRGYAGARAGDRGLNDADASDDFRVWFDVYGPEYSVYAGDILTRYLDDAVERGSWAVRELHGVEDDSWESIPLADYCAHLDDVAVRVEGGSLWMDTPTAILRYRRCRAMAGEPVSRGDAVAFESLPAALARHQTMLSVVVTTEHDAASIDARQGRRALQTKKLAPRRFSVDLLPAGGPAHFEAHAA